MSAALSGDTAVSGGGANLERAEPARPDYPSCGAISRRRRMRSPRVHAVDVMR